MKKGLLLAGVAALILVGFVVYIVLDSAPRAAVSEGDEAPNFKLPGAFGGQGELRDMRGKVVLLNFWATWCAPCVKEMPSLRDLQKHFRRQDFEVVAVALDPEGASAVVPFAQTHDLNFPIAVDETGSTQDLYGTTGLPESYLIDRDGIVRRKIIGPRDWTDRESVLMVAELVGKSGVAAPTANQQAPVTQPAEAQ